MPDLDPKTQNLISAMLLMAGLLVLVAIGIQLLTIYRRRLLGRSDAEADLAESFRQAFEAGELSEEEYRQIRESLDRGPVASPPRKVVPPTAAPPEDFEAPETPEADSPPSETFPDSRDGPGPP